MSAVPSNIKEFRPVFLLLKKKKKSFHREGGTTHLTSVKVEYQCINILLQAYGY